LPKVSTILNNFALKLKKKFWHRSSDLHAAALFALFFIDMPQKVVGTAQLTDV